METGVYIRSAQRRGSPAPRTFPRRGARELAAAVLLVALVATVANPGIGLVAVLAGLVLVARGLSGAAMAGWRRALTGSWRDQRRRVQPGPIQRAATVVTVAAVLALGLAVFSYGGAVTSPSNSSLAIRSVEWLRDNGAKGVVSYAEQVFYTATAPSQGGPALRSLPQLGVGGGAAGSSNSAYRPPAMHPAIQPPLAGEGAWHATQARFATDPAPPILITSYRPDPRYPRVVAGLAWIDPRRARVSLYSGLKEPPVSSALGPKAVPPASRGTLLATFNSGFKHTDGNGGFFANGRLAEPMRQGLATVVGTRSGVDVRAWRGGSRPAPGVLFARQNLPLIVDRGRPNTALRDSSKWGVTVGNAVMVWRSGLGVDRQGNLIYAAADNQTARGLARILIHAGAVRAMELDINSYWVTLNTYAKPGARGAQKLLPGMTRPSTRYLTPDDRDFFAVFI